MRDLHAWVTPILTGTALCLSMLTGRAVADDLQTVRDRIRDGLMPASADARDAVLRQAADAARELRPDGTWPTIDYADQMRSGWDLRHHLERVSLLAKSVAVEPDENRAAARDAALRWWLQHDPQNPNWWHNQIGVPQLLGEIAILMGDDLRDADRLQIIDVLKRSKGDTWTGQNQVWTCGIHIIRGILARDEAVTGAAYRRLYDEVRVEAPTGEGIMPDASFHQHGAQFYSGGYGLAFANDVGRFIVYAWGTKFAPPTNVVEIYASFMLDGERWMMRGHQFDHSARGREITRALGESKPTGKLANLPTIVRALSQLDQPRKAEFAAFADQLAGVRPNAVVGNRHFWCSDYVAHQRDAFSVSIRMYSSRLLNTERVNDEGTRSHHLADGCTLLYRTGDEYTNLFPAWDWQRIPGTTAPQRDIATLEKNPQIRNNADFVGGASDGTVGVAAMDFSRGSMRFRKMWLCVDEGFIALGAGITDTTGNAVVTTLDQTRLQSRPDVADRAVTHNGFTYTLLSPGKLQCTAGEQAGHWSDIGTGSDALVKADVFKLWLDHGTSPKDASYAYSVFDTSHPAPTVQVLWNTPNLQAVRAGDVLGVAFFTAGTLTIDEGHNIAVDQPCVVLMNGNRVTVSNPRNAALTVHVRIDGKPEITFDLAGGPLAGSSVTRDR